MSIWLAVMRGRSAPLPKGRRPMTAFCELLAPMLRLLTARRTNGKLAPSETSALHERESHSASLSRRDSGDDEAMTSMPTDDRDDGASTLD